jgi:oligopeptide transport system permease protein
MHVYFSGGVGSNPINGIGFTDAMEMVSRTSEIKVLGNNTKNIGYWEVADNTNYCKSIYLGKCRYASFTYDSYAGALGEREFVITHKELEKYKKAKWISYNIDIDVETDTEGHNRYFVVEDTFELPEIKSDSCPLTYNNPEAKIVFDIEDIMVDQNPVLGDYGYKVNCKIIYYRYLGYSSMPTFLFGTDKTSRDMFKYVFEGLRNSLALGVMTFIICFLFGLAYGAISGYFGGVVDLIMERITDILSGVPWIVVMTLVVLKADSSSFGVFLLALCLTGWIGTAATTRTQFYRFRGREYVLASRTLGASDARLIAKHILPNAMGTIITGAVLMIPSVIFSEATISYLGLGFKNLSSLGVILSDNQSQLTSHPYQLIFPSIVIALLMISFNLFGNGLRDAINPSLKGEEE